MAVNSVSNGLDKYAEKIKQLLKSEQDNIQKGNEQLKKITDSHNKTNTDKTNIASKADGLNAKETAEQPVQPKTDTTQNQEIKKQLEQTSIEQQRNDFINTKQEANAFAKNILKDSPKMAQNGELSKAPQTANQKNQLVDNLIKQEIPQQVAKDAKPKTSENTKTPDKSNLKQNAFLDKNDQIRNQQDLSSKIVVKSEAQQPIVVKPTLDGAMVADKKSDEKSEVKSDKKKSSDNAVLVSRGASKGLRQLNEGFGFDTNTNLNGGDDEGFYLDADTISIEKLSSMPSGTLSGLVGMTFDEGEVVGSSEFLGKARFFHSQVLKEKTIRTTIANVSEMQDEFGMSVEKRIPSEHLRQIRLGKTTGVYRGWLNV